MGAMPVGCYKQVSSIKEGVILRLQWDECMYRNKIDDNIIKSNDGLVQQKVNYNLKSWETNFHISGEHLVAYAVCYPLNTFIQKKGSGEAKLVNSWSFLVNNKQNHIREHEENVHSAQRKLKKKTYSAVIEKKQRLINTHYQLITAVMYKWNVKL